MTVYSLDMLRPDDHDSKKALSSKQLTYLNTDVSDAKTFTSRLEEIFKCHQRLDCLVNNAGFFETSENNNILWNPNTTTEQINFMLNTNFGSVVHGTRTAVNLMKQCTLEQGSRKTIINIASTAALGPFPMHPVYCSCKSAILQFSRTAQIDLEPEGFRIYAVCPGVIDTEMGRMGGERNRRMVAELKGGKRTKPELVAAAAVGLLLQEKPEWNDCSYLIVDNHEIINK
jgi:NAD(P)-dependent dehydrogenase (short-subunit alcohol dehydrogenase family)